MNTTKGRIWQKRIAIVLLFMIIFFLVFQSIPEDILVGDSEDKGMLYYASSTNSRKVISLVYDDSASMSDAGNKNWAYANYAFQMFTSMLGENDDLYVTYMSDPDHSELIVNPEINRQESVDLVYNHYDNQATPVSAVTTAFNKLNELENEESAEYWMVVITDGYLQESGSNKLLSSAYVDTMMHEYANTILQNGSPLNVVYLGIGEDIAVVNDEKNSERLVVKYAKGGEDIVDRMNEIAKEIKKWDDDKELGIKTDKSLKKKVIIKSDYPIRSIVILNQQSNAKVVDFYKNEQNDDNLKIENSLDIKYPEYPGNATDKSLIGTTTWLGSNRGYLDEGEYEILFDGNIDDSIEILYEVASEERLYIQDSMTSEYVTQTDKLFDDREYSMYTKNVVSGTETLFRDYIGADQSEQKDDLMVVQNNEIINSSVTNQLARTKYRDGFGYSECNTEIRGVKRTLVSSIPFIHNGIYTSKITGTNDIVYRHKIIDKSLKMQVKIFHDGQQYTKRELEDMHLVVHSAQTHINVQTSIEKDGTLIITPYFGRSEIWFKIIAGWVPSWIIKPGTYQVVMNFFDKNQKVTFLCNEAYTIKEESLPLNIFYHMVPIIVFIYIFGLTRKRRIDKNMLVNYIQLSVDGELYTADKRDWVEWEMKPRIMDVIPIIINLYDILPYVAERRNNEHIRIISSGDDRIVKITLKHNLKITSLILREDTISRRRDVQIHLDSERLLKVDSTQLKTDESIAFIIENEKNHEQFLYLISFNRKERDRARKNRR